MISVTLFRVLGTIESRSPAVCESRRTRGLIMARPLKVNAIALISQANHPIIVRPFTDEDPLKYHYVAHTSLDVVEERRELARPVNSISEH